MKDDDFKFLQELFQHFFTYEEFKTEFPNFRWALQFHPGSQFPDLRQIYTFINIVQNYSLHARGEQYLPMKNSLLQLLKLATSLSVLNLFLCFELRKLNNPSEDNINLPTLVEQTDSLLPAASVTTTDTTTSTSTVTTTPAIITQTEETPQTLKREKKPKRALELEAAPQEEPRQKRAKDIQNTDSSQSTEVNQTSGRPVRKCRQRSFLNKDAGLQQEETSKKDLRNKKLKKIRNDAKTLTTTRPKLTWIDYSKKTLEEFIDEENITRGETTSTRMPSDLETSSDIILSEKTISTTTTPDSKLISSPNPFDSETTTPLTPLFSNVVSVADTQIYSPLYSARNVFWSEKASSDVQAFEPLNLGQNYALAKANIDDWLDGKETSITEFGDGSNTPLPGQTDAEALGNIDPTCPNTSFSMDLIHSSAPIFDENNEQARETP